jgi:Prophage tail length tape measure protein
MSVTAAQLIGTVEIVNVDESIAQLESIGVAVDEADARLATLGAGAGEELSASLAPVEEELAGVTAEADAAAASISEVSAASTEAAAAGDEAAAGMAGFGGEALVALGGIAALGIGLDLTVKSAMDMQEIQAQTAQAIKSTGDASGMSAEQIHSMAESLANVTPYSEEATQGAENILLTFTDIGHNVFPQATQAILDVSQAMHQDLKSSAIQVGKALDDPVKGMSALQRIGVTFTESQKKAVAEMVKTGNIAGAQGVILKELQREFGGCCHRHGVTAGLNRPGKMVRCGSSASHYCLCA